MTSKFVDKDGRPLKGRVYFAANGNGPGGDLYYITLGPGKNIFSADSKNGDVSIRDYELFASNLIPLANPLQNIMFAASKLEGSLIE